MKIQLLILLFAVSLSGCTTQKTEIRTPVTHDDALLSPPLRSPVLLAAAQPVTGIVIPGLNQDLWQRLSSGFKLPAQDNSRIRSHRNRYLKSPSFLPRMQKRASPFLLHITNELEKRNMPMEIALLPIVESAYDPFAYSHGRAAGLWQFIPSTGKYYGLKQDWWYDGRRDVLDSTTAALDYLQHLHKRFDGDWLLALAAYNSGQATVRRAQRKNRKKNKPTTFWDLDLPKETRAYVPKLLALKQFIAEPAQYSLTLKHLSDKPVFEVIDTHGQIDLAIAAKLAGISLETLYRFNPGFNRWATPPKGPHRLLIPVENAKQLRTALKNLPLKQRIQWIRHKINSGDTLSDIAALYRTTSQALRSANDLSGSGIRSGRYLLVPVASQSPGKYSLSKDQRRQLNQQAVRGSRKDNHLISRGDTLWDLSRKYRVSVKKLAAWNSMAPGDTLKVGQSLVIWTGDVKTARSHPGKRTRPIHYTVRKGDSLSRISTRFKVSVSNLRRWNKLLRNRYLQPGQKLKLYVDVTSQLGST